tara:strand:+ start:604 stop:1149 length:546 start_codon:yes stop_codon:yes gene_type:complete
MSWAEVKADQVINIINGAMAVEKDGIKHPASIFSLWSSDELIKIGYYPYREVKEQADSRFYSKSNIKYTISKTEVVGTISANARDLNKIKKNYLIQINTTAYNLLHPTDWIVIKAQELGTTVDSKITTYRSAIRTKCNELEKAMTDASNVVEITAIIDSPGVDENEDMIPPPINDWPVLEE